MSIAKALEAQEEKDIKMSFGIIPETAALEVELGVTLESMNNMLVDYDKLALLDPNIEVPEGTGIALEGSHGVFVSGAILVKDALLNILKGIWKAFAYILKLIKKIFVGIFRLFWSTKADAEDDVVELEAVAAAMKSGKTRCMVNGIEFKIKLKDIGTNEIGKQAIRNIRFLPNIDIRNSASLVNDIFDNIETQLKNFDTFNHFAIGYASTLKTALNSDVLDMSSDIDKLKFLKSGLLKDITKDSVKITDHDLVTRYGLKGHTINRFSVREDNSINGLNITKVRYEATKRKHKLELNAIEPQDHIKFLEQIISFAEESVGMEKTGDRTIKAFKSLEDVFKKYVDDMDEGIPSNINKFIGNFRINMPIIMEAVKDLTGSVAKDTSGVREFLTLTRGYTLSKK